MSQRQKATTLLEVWKTFSELPSSDPGVYDARLFTAVFDQYSSLFHCCSLEGGTTEPGWLHAMLRRAFSLVVLSSLARFASCCRLAAAESTDDAAAALHHCRTEDRSRMLRGVVLVCLASDRRSTSLPPRPPGPTIHRPGQRLMAAVRTARHHFGRRSVAGRRVICWPGRCN